MREGERKLASRPFIDIAFAGAIVYAIYMLHNAILNMGARVSRLEYLSSKPIKKNPPSNVPPSVPSSPNPVPPTPPKMEAPKNMEDIDEDIELEDDDEEAPP